MMRKQVNSKGREDSVASKWADLMQYEKEIEDPPKNNERVQERENVNKTDKFQKIKENTSKKFSFIKSQISGLCR
jgi:hypothetical protein